LREGEDMPLDKNDEIADLKVYVRQNQEDLETLRLDMNRQEYLHQVLNDNVDKQNKALKSKLEKIAKQLETQVSELKSDLKTQVSELKSELKILKAELQKQIYKNAEQLKDVYTQLEKLSILDSYTYRDPTTGNRYKVIKDKMRTWVEAKSLCQQDGAELVSIRNDKEWQFVKGILDTSFSKHADSIWLGGSFETTKGFWVWTDGSPVTYSDWYVSNPDGGTSQNCLMVYRSSSWQWLDTPCTWTTYAVCKIPA